VESIVFAVAVCCFYDADLLPGNADDPVGSDFGGDPVFTGSTLVQGRQIRSGPWSLVRGQPLGRGFAPSDRLVRAVVVVSCTQARPRSARRQGG